MQSRTHFLTLAAGILAVFSVSAAHAAQAEPSTTVVAVFSEEDAQFAETITLYADGKYQQAETDKKAKLYHAYPSQHPFPQEVLPLPGEELPPLLFGGSKRSGTWCVLNKGGQLIAFKTLASLPKDAVVEVKGAMPFGITWERQRPYFLHGDRTLPASSFQAAPATHSKNSPPLTGEGGKP